MMPRKRSSPAPVSPPTALPARWPNRIQGHGEVDPHTLLPNPYNWRVHTPFQHDAVEGALDALGWIAPISVNTTTGRLVDGHLRVALAIEQGEPLVPVDYVSLTEEEEALALATRDPLTALAEAQGAAYQELMTRFEAQQGALGQVIEDLRRRYQEDFTPPDLDDLAGRYKEPEERDFWPVLQLAIPPEVQFKYRLILEMVDGVEEHEKFAALLDAAERTLGPVTLPEEG